MPFISPQVAGLCAGLSACLFAAPVGSSPVAVSPVAHSDLSTSALFSQPATVPNSSFFPADKQQGSPVISVTTYGDPIISPQGNVQVSVVITNPKNQPAKLGGVSFYAQRFVPSTVHNALNFMRGNISNLARYDRQLDGEVLQPGASREVTFSFPRSQFPQQWGPRGMEISAVLDGEEFTHRSFLIFAPEGDVPRVPANVTIPFTSDFSRELNAVISDKNTHNNPLLQGFYNIFTTETPTPAVDKPEAEKTAVDNSAFSPQNVSYVNRLSFPGVSFAVDPLLAKNPQYMEMFRSLATLPHSQILFLPAGDMDAAVFAHSGMEENSVSFLHHAMDQGKIEEQLLGGQARSDIFLCPPGCDAATVALAKNLGYTAVLADDRDLSSDETTSPVFSSLLASAISGVVPTEKQENLLYKKTEERYFTDETSLAINPDQGRQLALALSAIMYDNEGRGNSSQNILLDRENSSLHGPNRATNSALQPDVLSQNINVFLNAPWLFPATLSPQPDTSPSLAEKFISPQELSSEELAGVTHTIQEITSVSSIFENPALVDDYLHTIIEKITSINLRSDVESRRALISYLEDLRHQLQQSVQVDDSSTVNIISEKTNFPVHLKNSTPAPVTVYVELDSHDYRMVPGEAVKVTIPASSSITAQIPITTQGSGDMNISVSITAPNGTPLGAHSDIKVRVRAHWETRGAYAMGVAVLGLFMYGTYRSFRRGRRSTEVNPDDHLKALKRDIKS